MISNIKRKLASSSASFSSSWREREQNTSSSSNKRHQSSSRTPQSQRQYQQCDSEQKCYCPRHRNSSATNWSITCTLLNEATSYQPPRRQEINSHSHPDSYEAFMQNALEEEQRRERHKRAVRKANDAWQQGFRRSDAAGTRIWLQSCGLAK
ncbi:uncharacterized protein EAF01_003520 [Botrytis porri]|uniref:uncharacterized protein n=1 Tax=Botrytis porri TaxID=87229 RepID=UPI001901786A|nr:uncharacterized protein EAF01_003520 [Botrytis porri]KAF7909802.1 hypothetical protein EAF01_003520 [Botrytis porri]